MSAPTIEEMRLAVARMLPDEIGVRYPVYSSVIDLASETVKEGTRSPRFFWKGDASTTVRETEWLHVCGLVEKLLTLAEYSAYKEVLKKLTETPTIASVEHRIEALCTVFCPEMFTQSEGG